MLKRTLLAAFLLLWLPLSAAGAQDGPEQRIQAARRRAEQTGIPVALLNSKVAEGQAKGVPMDRIATAVERRLDALTRARAAMAGDRGQAVAANDLLVGADALEAGVDARVLGTLAARAPAGSRAVAIAVLTELVQAGVASERALERVTAALAQGPDAVARLQGEASAERDRGGGSPGGRGPAATPGERGRGRGRSQGGGPPASVPGPKKERPNRPDRPDRP